MFRRMESPVMPICRFRAPSLAIKVEMGHRGFRGRCGFTILGGGGGG